MGNMECEEITDALYWLILKIMEIEERIKKLESQNRGWLYEWEGFNRRTKEITFTN